MAYMRPQNGYQAQVPNQRQAGTYLDPNNPNGNIRRQQPGAMDMGAQPVAQPGNGLKGPPGAPGSTQLGPPSPSPAGQRGLAGGQPGPSGGNPAPLQSAGPATGGTGFVNLQRYLELNQGAGTSMATNMNADVQSRAGKASGAIAGANEALGNGDIEGAQTYMKGASGNLGQDVKDVGFLSNSMGTQAGRESYLGQQNPGHSAGVNSLDAFLGGASGAGTGAAAPSNYQNLQKQFAQAQGDLTYQQDAQAADPTYEERNKEWLRTSKKPGYIES